MESSPTRPTPETRNFGADFWRAAAKGLLRVPFCTGCDRCFWHPRPRCPYCGADDVRWKPSTGKGTIYTYTIVRQSADPYFKGRLPYVVAMVTLDEGPRIMSNIVASDVDSVRVGDRVAVIFDTIAPDIAIPEFRVEAAAR